MAKAMVRSDDSQLSDAPICGTVCMFPVQYLSCVNRIWVCTFFRFLPAIFLVCLCLGCFSGSQRTGFEPDFGRNEDISAHELPDAVYVWPEQNIYSGSRVLIQTFQSPAYAPRIGSYTAETLAKQLRLHKVFGEIQLDGGSETYSPGDWRYLLAGQNCDLLITGRVNFFLEGSSQQPSKVVVETKVYEMAGDFLHLLWHMQADAFGEPRASKDWYIYRSPPVPAPSGQELVQRCSIQFANALLHVPPRDH